MPVSFGTVEVIPQSAAPAAPAAASSATAGSSGPPAIDPRELAPAARRLAEREARVRAH
jgi:hypothetical protein